MGNGYRVPGADSLDELSRILQRGSDRTSEVERPSGTQTAEALKTLRQLIDGLIEQTDGNFSGTLTVAGTSTLGLVNSLATYSRNVSGSGGFNTMQVNLLGHYGYVPSSLRYKEILEEAPVAITREQLRSLRLVLFRYIATVPFDQDQQPVLLGLIAEEVHAIPSLRFLVIYGPDGLPEQLREFSLAFLGLLLAQMVADEVDDLRNELRALKDSL